MKDITLLGSTGSVGKNVLDVVARYPGRFRVRAMVAGGNIDLLSRQAEIFSPGVIACCDETLIPQLKKKAPRGTIVTGGAKAVEKIAAEEESDIVFFAISGTSSLLPLVGALKNSRTVALASKEPIVSAGKIISDLARRNSARIIPVDSEHSAVDQCLWGRDAEDVRTVYLTGSGGALLDRETRDFDRLSRDEILAHPKWDMGPKITVDSATLMNKGLEVIEARWLFGLPAEKIKVVIHPEALVHAIVEFVDGTSTACLFSPDMRFPILRALSYPGMIESDLERVDLCRLGKLTFRAPDVLRFPALTMAYEALRRGGTYPAVLNSSNDKAVNLFLEGRISFTDIIRVTEKVVSVHAGIQEPSLDDIIAAEEWAKEEVLKFC